MVPEVLPGLILIGIALTGFIICGVFYALLLYTFFIEKRKEDKKRAECIYLMSHEEDYDEFEEE